ncbi:hypothetical protein QRN89_25245 [Streptomyces chengbuensis]|uniref:hypothetical protein n=1 Tax=Streptomyces TaxID=1883 RepID=UPI0025B41183|nr:hypothetical protein [Streptomyces sp. HUAS CB01]WJY52823.1 hypothetical protein QRN89_25245 [Streptomyces sp. HUAS CB01]
MSTSWRQRALERNREDNARFFADQDADHLSEDAYEEELRRHWLEAVRHYDPAAQLHEELVVRLRGEAADRGALDFRIGDALLKPLREGVSAAARKDVELELTGVSRGSTVLHVRPSVPEVVGDADEDLAVVDSSIADPAMRDFLKLVEAAEKEQDVRRWERIVPGLDGVVEALDKFDLSMDMRWFSLDGTVRSSHLSRRGKDYVRSLRNTELQKSRMGITGRITELRESGVVKIKTGVSRTSSAYEVRVDPEALIGMHLELGMTISFVVEVSRRTDRLGRARSTEYRFLRLSDGQERLFEE